MGTNANDICRKFQPNFSIFHPNGRVYVGVNYYVRVQYLGGDAVGMSTACEAVAANHMGMKICGISFISNLACGMTDQPLSHEEVGEAAAKAAPKFKALVTKAIMAMGE